jgi:DNA repair ATPase RecN
MNVAESPTAETSLEEEEEQLEKLNVLKSKVEANIAYLPKVLDKMKESVARCEKTENLNVNIHPVFQR